jgi:hypothetical protein
MPIGVETPLQTSSDSNSGTTCASTCTLQAISNNKSIVRVFDIL